MTNILGINIDTSRTTEMWKKVLEFINSDKQHYIVTPNPEIILAAGKDEELFYILNQADLSIPDGIGLKMASLLFGKQIHRFTGADLTIKLLKYAEENNINIAIINWSSGLSSNEEISNELIKQYPRLNYIIKDIERVKKIDTKIIEDLNNFKAKIIFVSLGFPYQEKLIYHNLKELTSARLALGIGGSFDFITNKRKRAPKIFRILGLEWCWRLIINPSRIKRIYNAVYVFCIKVLKTRFVYPFFYRPNVACWLYKKEGNRIKILIVERQDDLNHWQIPQGGTDGESLSTAGRRELSEELNTGQFITKKTFKKVYKYRIAPQKVGSRYFQTNYKGQSQGLYIAEYTGNNDIKVNFWDHSQFKWIDIDQIVDYVHPRRKKATEIFLNKFKTLNIK